ncbi:pseudouridine synthase [Echinicola jeungdonensis]|uniref:Pseudouridine synthase n=1 Tax=Echinicola jeungdonensis TaxID=709343 RepID=A0ABV5J8S3_9BACT|nr:pseudouridine synthase [Echinicola jeungdonensis]MDN3670782.1 pseudouridine synthase [Echinicola jeungdonensis]
MELPILFEDDFYIAINKPAGLLVHKTSLAMDAEPVYAMQLLRDQIGQRVYPIHRIDRPTSGILWFAKSPDVVRVFQELFLDKEIKKYYLAIVRGYTKEEQGLINQPLKKNLNKDLQEAQTEYLRLGQIEIPEASSPRHSTSRYSLVRAFPHTGRMHQIRRHFAHERNYIIGDKTHGDNKQNRFFRMHFQMPNMLLHAWKTQMNHPVTGKEIHVEAPVPSYFNKILKEFNWESLVHEVKYDS